MIWADFWALLEQARQDKTMNAIVENDNDRQEDLVRICTISYRLLKYFDDRPALIYLYFYKDLKWFWSST